MAGGRQTLPGVLGEIAEVAGLPAALALAREHGGTEVYLPIRPDPNHWLVACVGPEAAEAICTHYAVRDADGRAIGNFRLLIPLAGTGAYAQVRRRLIQELREGNGGVPAAARKAGVHERTAWRYKAKLRDRAVDHDPQGDLFASTWDRDRADKININVTNPKKI